MMEDSLSSSYDSSRTRAMKKKRRSSAGRDSSRSGPEGNSIGQSTQVPLISTSTPASISPRKNRKKQRSMQASESEDTRSNISGATQSTSQKTKRKGSRNSMMEGVGDSFGSMDSKRSRFSSLESGLEESTISRKKSKATERPVTDLSWELAVEKARGMPDGAMNSDMSDSMDEDEIDVDAPPPPKLKKGTPQKEPDKGKSKPFSVIQCAAKKFKSKKSKTGSESESPKKAVKRKSEEDLNAAEEKKVKAEDLSKKDRKTQRKSQKTNYDTSMQAKGLWGQLRRSDIPLEKRQQISTDLYNNIKGKAKELIFTHDTSRVIQCLLKYGTQEHKNAIFEELREFIVEMSKSKYAKFFVRKLLKYGTKAQRNYVFRKLYGNVRKLIKHKEAAEIIECAYNDYANAVQRHALVQEFYGPSFALFKTMEEKSLDQIIQSNPEKRDSILSNMKETLTAVAEKSVLQYSIIHRVFLEFFTYATEKLRTEMIDTIREGIIHMLHTRDGARVAMLCLWHGTAKDRKTIVKSFKTYMSKICKEEYGHMVLLALFDVVDDTKLVQKALLDELLKSVDDLAVDPYGRKVLLYLLCARDPVHFHPDVVNILKQGDGNAHSKKESEVRRRELLEYVSRPLIQYIKQHCTELVTNNSTLLLILSIITHAKSDPTEAMRAVSELAAEPFVAGSLENTHIVEHTAGHMTLKKLILNDAQRIENGESAWHYVPLRSQTLKIADIAIKSVNEFCLYITLFAGILLDILPEGSLKSWAACNRGCFILITLLELNHPEVTRKVRKEIVPITESLRRLDFKGAQNLINKLK